MTGRLRVCEFSLVLVLTHAGKPDIARKIDRHTRHPQPFGVDLRCQDAESFVRLLVVTDTAPESRRACRM
jgi:hypothetical protein